MSGYTSFDREPFGHPLTTIGVTVKSLALFSLIYKGPGRPQLLLLINNSKNNNQTKQLSLLEYSALPLITSLRRSISISISITPTHTHTLIHTHKNNMAFTNSMSQFAWWKTYLTPKRYSHNKIPDLTGKVAIVTGANSGLGYATTVALAANGARVFLACRSKERAQEAIENARAEIKAKYPKAPTPQLEFLELDLNDMTKSSQAAQEFLKKGLPLHILINNSGIMNCPYGLSADGIETQFAVNHMG